MFHTAMYAFIETIVWWAASSRRDGLTKILTSIAMRKSGMKQHENGTGRSILWQVRWHYTHTDKRTCASTTRRYGKTAVCSKMHRELSASATTCRVVSRHIYYSIVAMLQRRFLILAYMYAITSQRRNDTIRILEVVCCRSAECSMILYVTTCNFLFTILSVVQINIR